MVNGALSKASSLVDHEALHGAPEITLSIGKTRHRQAGALGADPAFGIEQDPLAERLARHADGEVGVEEGPVPEIQRGRGTVGEVGGRAISDDALVGA